MTTKTFSQWLYEDGRKEALQDVYFDDQMGPGSEFLDWAQSVYNAMQKPFSPSEPRPRIWPFTE
ncbi:hypothetical protein ALO81_200301 [Pseudomonas cannabina]|uniref:Uncharacterized protein n=1 Tax=Pseudomonas cannabina TaxID=86840 RepID=A0A0P9LMM7_PSECA|nr:hypothetical protein ALO81_200301 [Pseudomonas cannabina]